MEDDECRAPFILLLNSVDGRGRQYHLLQSSDEIARKILDMCEAEVVEKKSSEAAERKLPPPSLVQYDTATVLNFVDMRLSEAVVLVASEPGQYVSSGKGWVKKVIVDYLLKNVERSDDDEDE